LCSFSVLLFELYEQTRTLSTGGNLIFQELAEETRALLREGIPYFVLVETGSPNGFEFTGGVAKIFTAKPVGD